MCHSLPELSRPCSLSLLFPVPDRDRGVEDLAARERGAVGHHIGLPAVQPLSRTVAVLVAFEGFTSVTPVNDSCSTAGRVSSNRSLPLRGSRIRRG